MKSYFWNDVLKLETGIESKFIFDYSTIGFYHRRFIDGRFGPTRIIQAEILLSGTS